MVHLFKNFYAIPLQQVVLLMIIGIAIWTLLGSLCVRQGQKWKRVWQAVNVCLCILSLIVIIKKTLIGRTAGMRQLELRPFYALTTVSYNNEAYRTLLMNIFLFFPLGLTLPWALPESESVTHRIMMCALMALGFSIVIECIQFWFCLGRAETDDVICNTLGCVIGMISYLAVRIRKGARQKRKSSLQSARRVL